MTEALTITNKPLEPGMDYARLRAEGQQIITGLAGHLWTDHNATDPGITLLESLCYALTDLGYRLGFDVPDLLAAAPDSSPPGKQFFSAREILTVNPLTVIDYRKLLVDIKGVRNAWLETAGSTETPAVYDQATASLSFPYGVPDAGGNPGKLNGLYRVLLELDGSEAGEDVIKQSRRRLRQFRNTGEDISEIRVLRDVQVTIKAAIEISRNADADRVFADVYESLFTYLSPLPTFRSLDEMLASGRAVEDVFNGPPLEHGFLDDAELEIIRRRTEIHTADIIYRLMRVEGVSAVRNVRLSQAAQDPVEWVLKLQDPVYSRPVLKPVAQLFSAGDITLFSHNGVNTVLPDKDIVVKEVENRKIREAKTDQARTAPADISPPAGHYRNLTDYVSIQGELPGNFGVGSHGLSNTAGNRRRAQARQLQAYLLVFDQLLVNYLAQLANARELLAVVPGRGVAAGNSPPSTYFSAPLPAHVAGVEDIIFNYGSDYRAWLAGLLTDAEADTDRMNRFLDHLLARHGQDFTHAAALYPLEDGNLQDQVPVAAKVIPAKQRFLRDYGELSKNRAKGYDYTYGKTWDTDNVAGLEKRIKGLLDIEDVRRHSLAGAEGCHMVDHILLRPVLPSGHITFLEADTPDKVRCAGTHMHGLQDADEVGFVQTTGGNYLQSVHAVEIVDEHEFLISENYVTPDNPTTEKGIWIPALQKRGPAVFFSSEANVISRGEPLPGDNRHATVIAAPGMHKLDAGDVVFVTGAGTNRLNGLHRVRSVTRDHFEIDVPFDPAFAADASAVRWYRHPLYPDPYSCQVSFVFPAASGRAAPGAGGQQFRDLVAEIIRTETPAHITPHLYWLEDDSLNRFEADYRAWLEAKAAVQTNSQQIRTTTASNKLLGWLI